MTTPSIKTYDATAGAWRYVAGGTPGALPAEVHVGTTAPTDTSVLLWVDTTTPATPVLNYRTASNTWAPATTSGLTEAEIDALFLKPSEILAGANITVSTASGTVTVSSPSDLTQAEADALYAPVAHAHAPSGTPTTRALTAGSGLTGGGDLSADRTFDVGAGTGITVAADTVAVDTAVIATRTYVDGKALPVGGTTSQVLAKTSATDFATAWQTITAGSTILSGTATPTGATGATGDYYLDTDDRILYGPKSTPGVNQSAFTSQTPTASPNLQGVWGAKIRVAVAGEITAIRYWRGFSAARTSHTLSLWSDTGTLLGSAVTSGESGTGWVTATLAAPVAVAASQVVVPAFDTSPSGSYLSTSVGGSSFANGDLTMVNGGQYNNTSGLFPNTADSGTRYFVDVVFRQGVAWPVALRSVPPGGTTGQYLNKTTATDYDTTWATPAATGTPTTRALTAGSGLTGGGDLSADRTFTVGAGTGITVNADDIAVNRAVVDTWYTAAGAGSGLQTRATASKTTGTLAVSASETGTITLAAGYRLYSITSSAAARIRLYTTTAKRDADLTRSIGVDPAGDHGLMFEYVAAAGMLSADLTPTVDGFDGKVTPDGAIPCTITNMTAGSAAIQVQFSWIRTE